MTDRARSTVVVDAPPAAVMAVVADFAGYPSWTRYLRSAQVLEVGPDGRARAVRFVLDAGAIADEYTLAYTWDGDTAVRWELVSGRSITAMDGSYLLSAVSGGTQVSYELSVSVAVPLLAVFKRKAEQVLVDTALAALKNRVEATVADRRQQWV